MLIQRSLGFFKKLRSYSQFATTAAARSYWTTPTPGSTGFSHIHSGSSTRKKPHWDLMSAIILSGQTAIFLGLSRNHVFAEDASATDDVSDNNKTREYVSGLRRIEDGSVISNSHTSKWRIFTDNGRDLFLKGKLDEAEKYFQLALEEAKEGFGPRDPHVASSCNNLAELYRVRKAFQKAEPLYLDAINILKESFGIDDIRVGAAFQNLGQFYLSQRQLDQARTYYERALKIKGRVLGYGHPDYANTMYHLGTVLHLQGNNKDAEALILESIRILEEIGDGETLTCLRRMKYLSQEANTSQSEAELALRECISIYKEFTTRSLLLESAELRREYLSFLKRLSSRVNENRGSNMQVLKDEVQHIEAELSAPHHVEKSD